MAGWTGAQARQAGGKFGYGKTSQRTITPAGATVAATPQQWQSAMSQAAAVINQQIAASKSAKGMTKEQRAYLRQLHVAQAIIKREQAAAKRSQALARAAARKRLALARKRLALAKAEASKARAAAAKKAAADRKAAALASARKAGAARAAAAHPTARSVGPRPAAPRVIVSKKASRVASGRGTI